MAFAQGSRSRLAYIVENTFGDTPSNPTLIELPYNSHSLNLSKEVVESDEIRSDRLTAVQRHGQRQVGGDISVDFRADDFDDLIESAMFSTFDTSGQIDVGTTPKYVSIEDGALDISQYRVFTGCAVDSWSMSVAPNQMVQSTFTVVGKDQDPISGTSLAASPTSASSNAPFDSFSGTIDEGGSSIAIVTSIDFTLNNSLAPTFVIGQQDTPQLEYGRGEVTGTLEVYFENADILNKFLDETETSLEFTLDDGVSGNLYTFTMPRVKLNSGSVPVENEQSRMISMDFVALRDSSTGTNLRVAKS
jgi:hypothetical protein